MRARKVLKTCAFRRLRIFVLFVLTFPIYGPDYRANIQASLQMRLEGTTIKQITKASENAIFPHP